MSLYGRRLAPARAGAPSYDGRAAGHCAARGDKLVSECRDLLEKVLPLTVEEQEFIARLNDWGDIAPELPTNDSVMIVENDGFQDEVATVGVTRNPIKNSPKVAEFIQTMLGAGARSGSNQRTIP